MAGGTWPTGVNAQLPVRSGTYIDFIGAVNAALTPGTTGSVALIGTADWGPESAQYANSQGTVDNTYGGATYGGTLRDAAIQALDGFDDGGAQFVYTVRAVGSAGAAATIVLDDGSSSPALTLTALYPGVRANNWTVTVQTNVTDSSNEDILIYENGVQIAQFLNITGGTNTAAAAAIAASGSPWITAEATGSANRALKTIVAGSSGTSFAGGNSGTTLTVDDYGSALNLLSILIFDAIALANVTDGPTQDAFIAWVQEYNSSSGFRTFGVIGGAEGEAITTAIARSYSPDADTGDYNDCDVVNIGVTDLLRTFDQTVLSTAYLAPRVAGAISAAALGRATTGMTWTGYTINPGSNSPPSNAGYGLLVQNGVFCFRQDNPTTISVEEGITSQVTYNSVLDDNGNILNPQAHQQIANVAIDHFIADTLLIQGNAARGTLRNTGAGQVNFIGNVIAMLRVLEKQSVLEAGSTCQLAAGYNNSGNQLFLQVGITYVEFVNQFFFTIAVSG